MNDSSNEQLDDDDDVAVILTLDTVPDPLCLLCAASGQCAILDDDNLRGQVSCVSLRALCAHAVLPHQLVVCVHVRVSEQLTLCVWVGEGAGRGGRRRVSTCLRLKLK